MANSRRSRHVLLLLVALIHFAIGAAPVTAATTKATKATKASKATKATKATALPVCRANRQSMLVTLPTGKVYRCTKVAARSFKWRLLPAAATTTPAAPTPSAPATPTSELAPTSTAATTAPATTAPESTVPATTSIPTTSTTSTTTTATTTAPVTTTTVLIPASGPGTLRISVSGANRVPAEFTLKCIKPGFGRETKYALVSGESVEVRSLPAPIDCVISGLVATGVPVQPKATDSSAPTNDLKVTVLPLPSPPALFIIQNGAREIDPTGGGTPPIKTN